MFNVRNVAWALCGALGGTAAANVIHVPGDAPTIQAGIDVATGGDEVVVADGLYTGAGNRDIDFHGKSIMLRSASGDPALCVIDCQGLGRGFIFQSGETADSVVEGFTITNGNVGSAGGGGGMYLIGSCPTVTNCIFSNNSAGNGGGMFNVYSCPAVTGCAFTGNVASPVSGGGMDNYASDPVIEGCSFIGNIGGVGVAGGGGGVINRAGSHPAIMGCTFTGNTSGGMSNLVSSPTVIGCTFESNAGQSGAGIYDDGGTPTVIGCLFAGNTASGGGGLSEFSYHGPGSPLLVNCTFTGNTAYTGGGLFIQESHVTIINCTLTGNSASNGEAIRSGGGPVTLSNCIVWDNAIVADGPAPFTVSYSVVEGGFAGPGNVSQDPMFADPGAGNFRLLPGSPAIDAGSNVAIPSGVVTDFDGNPRFVDDPATPDSGLGTPPIVDMGAFEFRPPCTGDVDGDGAVGITDFLALLAAWGPNPGHPADHDGDGVGGSTDFLALLANWGPCP